MPCAPYRRLGLLCLAFACNVGCAAPPATSDNIDTGAGNLVVVLRESRGENKQDDTLQPYGKLEGTLPDGKHVQFETSWYRYLGDLHIRLVFEGSRSLQSASPDDLARLHLTASQALALAVANLRRLHGTPTVLPWTGGVMQVQAAEPEFTSSYFLDRAFWQRLQGRDAGGLVVAVPRRGELVFAAARDREAVANLRFSVAALYAGGPGAQLSSALYLFRDGHWSVFQPAQPPAD